MIFFHVLNFVRSVFKLMLNQKTILNLTEFSGNRLYFLSVQLTEKLRLSVKPTDKFIFLLLLTS